MEEGKIEQAGTRESLPAPYMSIEEGVRDFLIYYFTRLPNEGGTIRGGALLEPFNEESKEKVKKLLRTKLEKAVGEGKDLQFTGTNVEEVKEPLSKIVEKYKEDGPHFLTKYLEEHYSQFRDGILVIRADVNNLVSPEDVSLFGITIVENEPYFTLRDFCQGHNLKLLFLFDEWDYTKYLIWLSELAPDVRAMLLEAQMIDTDQVSNPEEFIHSRSVPDEVKEKWLQQVR